MDAGEERRALRFLERIADSLERIELKMCGERPKPAPPAQVPKDLASAVPMFHRDPRQEPSEYPSSTTTREKFWSEGDR